MSKNIEKLEARLRSEQEKEDNAKANKKELLKQITTEKRKERNHHIYQRGGELTYWLGDNH